MSSPELRDLTTLDDFAGVVTLEKRIWGLTDGDDVTPLPLLAATVKRGAILVGAFDPDAGAASSGGSARGVRVLAACCARRPALAVVAHAGRRARMAATRTGTRAEARPARSSDCHGRRPRGMDLRSAPGRQRALQHRLSRRHGGEYHENVYGASASPLHGSLPTDRLIAQWWVRAAHVEALAASRAADSPACPASLPSISSRQGTAGRHVVPIDSALTSATVRVPIPMGFTEMLGAAPAVAHRVACRDPRRSSPPISRGGTGSPDSCSIGPPGKAATS